MSGAEPGGVLRQIFRGNDEQWFVVRIRIGEPLAGMKARRPLRALQTTGPRRNRAVGIGTGVGANRGQLAARYRRNALRSEEHTSELQSLMRISYAVFCLKKKKKKYM